MADWVQIHVDFTRVGDKVTARCSMSGDKTLSGREVTATLSAVCKGLSHLSGISFDEERFNNNVKTDRPWFERIFGR